MMQHISKKSNQIRFLHASTQVRHPSPSSLNPVRFYDASTGNDFYVAEQTILKREIAGHLIQVISPSIGGSIALPKCLAVGLDHHLH